MKSLYKNLLSRTNTKRNLKFSQKKIEKKLYFTPPPIIIIDEFGPVLEGHTRLIFQKI